MNALVFLYKRVLELPLDKGIDAVRAERKANVPVVLTREEALNWFFRRGGATRRGISDGRSTIEDRGVPPPAGADLGGPAWEQALIAGVRVRAPVVLNWAECERLFEALKVMPRLMAELMYGSGLRLTELLRLRMQDVEPDSAG
jgi:integrase